MSWWIFACTSALNCTPTSSCIADSELGTMYLAQFPADHSEISTSHTMRILVIEDEPELLRVIAQALREEGYAVDEAADGDDGLFKAKSWNYDAIVLDLMLPGRDGWQ